MNYRDTLVTCQECGKQYIFTVEAQRKIAERGVEVAIPELCTDCIQRVKYEGQLHGRIKWFSYEKRWGFIVQDSGGEIFVHQDGVLLTDEGKLPPLDEGQEVLYDVQDTPKGPRAIKVSLYQG